MAESAGSPAAVSAANSPQQQQQQQPPSSQQQQQQSPNAQAQTNPTAQPSDISSSQLASPPITGTVEKYDYEISLANIDCINGNHLSMSQFISSDQMNALKGGG
ncbi:hypothetical protein PV327_006243 [Microctonus hyperodae]|uniref:Uncharacterized protein n=1 Tax=Microctonus hyperodae TaxID=165561 RepID=A0AA39F3V6_MICHY|nr:hypothetical protein PV327_006243 [Microctonus hyperodae]